MTIDDRRMGKNPGPGIHLPPETAHGKHTLRAITAAEKRISNIPKDILSLLCMKILHQIRIYQQALSGPADKKSNSYFA
jgi:hypothetical protein